MLIFALLALKPNVEERAQKHKKSILKCVLEFHFASISCMGGSFCQKGQNRCILLLILLATVDGRWDSAITSRSPTLTNQELRYILYGPR